MKTAVINFLKKNWKNILIVTLCGAIAFLTYKSIRKDASSNIKVSDREYVDSASAYHIIYNDKTISQLKKENKELYDSIKKYKNNLTDAIQFKYVIKYNTDTVFISSSKPSNSLKIYSYSNKNDTLSYSLKIASNSEPSWYKFSFILNDKFTIYNTKENGVNETVIKNKNKGVITDVSVYKKNENNIFNKIAFGPSVSYGFSLDSHKLEPLIGVSLTYNIFGKK